jgi:hypothetical protein
MSREFPGVNPYIEAQGFWPDFHLKFLNYLQEALADHLPAAYEARLDERVQLTNFATETEHLIKPDLAVLRNSARAGRDRTGTLLLEPETIPTVIIQEETQAYLKILHRPDRQLVTIIELLSPANKAGESRRQYLERRNAILMSEAHLVELDFLKGGRSVPMRRPLPVGDFRAIVSREEQRPDCQVYTWTVDMKLPLIPIPLRVPDPDIEIDLAPVYQTAFERGRYDRSIDYGLDLDSQEKGE